jgi:C_GCAxxG_C_C family probable redox protein
MDQDLSVEARNKAGSYFKEGYNCAEAVFLAFKEYLAPEMDPDIVRMMTGFGGGLGHAGCICGALSGAIAAMNLKVGRTSNQQDRDEAYRCAQEFHERFQETFGATCCRALKTGERKDCLKIVGNTGKLLMDFLQEKTLYDPKP